MPGLEQFLPQLSSQDTKKRLQLGATILAYLEEPLSLVDTSEMGAIVDCLVAWLNSSNSKVPRREGGVFGCWQSFTCITELSCAAIRCFKCSDMLIMYCTGKYF